jgi:hypothetical protein
VPAVRFVTSPPDTSVAISRPQRAVCACGADLGPAATSAVTSCASCRARRDSRPVPAKLAAAADVAAMLAGRETDHDHLVAAAAAASRRSPQTEYSALQANMAPWTSLDPDAPVWKRRLDRIEQSRPDVVELLGRGVLRSAAEPLLVHEECRSCRAVEYSRHLFAERRAPLLDDAVQRLLGPPCIKCQGYAPRSRTVAPVVTAAAVTTVLDAAAGTWAEFQRAQARQLSGTGNTTWEPGCSVCAAGRAATAALAAIGRITDPLLSTLVLKGRTRHRHLSSRRVVAEFQPTATGWRPVWRDAVPAA